ncbi:DUF2933 domain-containing protein [Propionivibrio soli]|uniref:DUF2933 domain-containing protein n=1 Tax=Propionivibrio soli TaxID=2976531 RepID=UPI0021E7E5A8|nr:DUF2933 domain-containing protein [Propionivibrio soli]
MRNDTHSTSTFWRSRTGTALLVLGALALFVFLVEHRVHALGYLPYLFLLICPLMHFFMHRGHGHEHAQHQHSNDHREPPEENRNVR